MAASSRLMLRFPARIRIAVPPQGLGQQLDHMTAWLDANCGTGNWAMMPAGLRGVVSDALAIYFRSAAYTRTIVLAQTLRRWAPSQEPEADTAGLALCTIANFRA